MPRLVDWLKKLYHYLPPPPSTNYLCRKISPNPNDFMPAQPIIMDIGSKDARASYAFGAPPDGATIICMDIEPNPGVDLVMDAHDMRAVAYNSIDFVVSVSVLEHVRYPQKVMKEVHRILKPGGIVYVNVPFIFPYHADPDDFYRFSYRGIDILCEEFEKIDSGFNRGPASTIHHLLVHFLAIVFSFNSRALYGINVDLFKWMLFWLKYLDRYIARYEMAYVIHTGSYFLGRKK